MVHWCFWAFVRRNQVPLEYCMRSGLLVTVSPAPRVWTRLGSLVFLGLRQTGPCSAGILHDIWITVYRQQRLESELGWDHWCFWAFVRRSQVPLEYCMISGLLVTAACASILDSAGITGVSGPSSNAIMFRWNIA